MAKEGWAGAIPQQPLQPCAIGGGDDAHTGIDREAAVLVGQHLFGVKALDQVPAHKGAQDAGAGGNLHLGHGRPIEAAGWVERSRPPPATASNPPSTTQTWKCTCVF